MKHRWPTLLLLLMVLTALAVLLWPREPTYQGRRLGLWVTDLNCYEFVENRDTAEAAFRHFGTNALPYLSQELRRKDSSFKQKVMNWNERFQNRWNRNLIKLTSADYHRSGAFQAIEILGERAAPIIPDLIANLGDSELTGDSANALGAIGEPALPAILEIANSTNWYFRWAAAVALTPFTNQPSATQTLHALARDAQSEVRQAVAETIGNFQNDPASNVPLLATLLSDTNSFVRQTACTTLLGFGAEAYRAATALSNAMSDPALVTDAARVFRQVRIRAAQEIFGLLAHPTEAVRLEAISLTSGLRRYGTNCLPSLLPLLKDPAAKVRERAVQVIGGHRSAATNYVADLLLLLNDSDRDVRIQAIMALRIIPTDPKPYIQSLADALSREQDEIVRDSILTAFEQFGVDAKAAVPTLTEYARAHTSDDRIAALLPLAAVDPNVAKYLGAEDWLLEVARTNSLRLRMVFRPITNNFGEP